MQQGYISLHRKLLTWEWFTDINVCHLFIYCLLRANYKPTKWRGYEIKRGEFISSLNHISVDTGLSVQQVRTALDKLKKSDVLTKKQQGSNTLISIKNYSQYQESNKQDNNEITINQQTNNNEITTNNKDNKEIKINNDNKGIINAPNPNNIFNPIVKEFHNQMKDVLHYNIRLNGFQCDKVVELNQRIPDFIKSIPVVFERLKLISWNFEDGSIVNADVNWLLEKENYISVLNGKYTTKQQIIQEKLRRKELEDERR